MGWNKCDLNNQKNFSIYFIEAEILRNIKRI